MLYSRLWSSLQKCYNKIDVRYIYIWCSGIKRPPKHSGTGSGTGRLAQNGNRRYQTFCLAQHFQNGSRDLINGQSHDYRFGEGRLRLRSATLVVDRAFRSFLWCLPCYVSERTGAQSYSRWPACRTAKESKMATSQIRQNFTSECEAAINKHINIELHASYVYQSMVYITALVCVNQ